MARKDRIAELEGEVRKKDDRIAELQVRLAALEALMDGA